VITGGAGWPLDQIPDGLDEDRIFTRRPLQESAIDALWGRLDPDTRVSRVRNLCAELVNYYEPRGRSEEIQRAILKNGFRFENGDFVPVDASGKIPE
jgi:hypothetical protein